MCLTLFTLLFLNQIIPDPEVEDRWAAKPSLWMLHSIHQWWWFCISKHLRAMQSMQDGHIRASWSREVVRVERDATLMMASKSKPCVWRGEPFGLVCYGQICCKTSRRQQCLVVEISMCSSTSFVTSERQGRRQKGGRRVQSPGALGMGGARDGRWGGGVV